MTSRSRAVSGIAAAILTVIVLLALAERPTALLAQGPAAAKASALETPWGEPDLQGIWTNETEIPLQRPARFANKEFFTNAEIAEIDKRRAGSDRANRTRPP